MIPLHQAPNYMYIFWGGGIVDISNALPSPPPKKKNIYIYIYICKQTYKIAQADFLISPADLREGVQTPNHPPPPHTHTLTGLYIRKTFFDFIDQILTLEVARLGEF